MVFDRDEQCILFSSSHSKMSKSQALFTAIVQLTSITNHLSLPAAEQQRSRPKNQISAQNNSTTAKQEVWKLLYVAPELKKETLRLFLLPP